MVPLTDPLSDALALLNVRAAMPSRLEAGGRWALRFEGYEHVKLGAVLSGSCWLTVEGARPLRLEAGDCHGAGGIPGRLGALRDPQIGAVLALMHRQAGRRWTVAALAAEAGMSRTAFAVRFKALMGLPPLEYLLRRRMRSAAEALRTTDRTVASVAAEWGYASESAFSTAFKRVVGHPPAHHRPGRPATGISS
ncbi:AraC family transcriptional regulator [Nonomuraea sp. B12E4]|uniref:AraC family transcriptional regulator n=1 Tax=Nonomuraea sp. B12E4 TaxID=3153564 RepID=UPI00325CC828